MKIKCGRIFVKQDYQYPSLTNEDRRNANLSGLFSIFTMVNYAGRINFSKAASSGVNVREVEY